MAEPPTSPYPHASAVGLVCPYHSCGNCQYVGDEVNFGRACPACGVPVGSALATWPMIQWVHAADDIAFLYEHNKLELLTIAIASYYEGVLHSFLYDAMTLVHPPTRMIDINCSDIDDDDERWVAEQREARRRYQLIDGLFKKHRSWVARHTKLCEEVLGKPLDELLCKHMCNAGQFMKNRENIHAWRNVILHRGIPLEEAWPGNIRKAAPEIGLGFVRACWEAFRLLNNELVHKPYWVLQQRKAAEG